MGAIQNINRKGAVIAHCRTPWGDLGTTLDQSHSTESWLKSAGLDWTANKARNMFYDTEGNLQVGESNIVYRSDTKAELGTCADGYQIVQPFEVVNFYRELVESKGWQIEVVGNVDAGKRIWALAKTNGEIAVKGTVDRMGMYVLLATSFDGSLATTGTLTSLRNACSNILKAAFKGNDGKISVSHKTVFNAVGMKEKLGICEDATAKMQEDMDIFAGRKVSDKEAMQFIIDVLAGKDIKTEDISTRQGNIIKGVFDLYKGNGLGSTLATADGTLFGVLNAVTEHTSHHVNSRSDNNRFKALMFGAGDKINSTAYELAMKLAA